MGRTKKVKWDAGNLFSIPLENGKKVVGQVLGQSLSNTVRIALFDKLLKNDTDLINESEINSKQIFSLVEATKEQLDYSIWKVIGNLPILVEVKDQPNEKYRKSNWIGLEFYDAAIVEDFVNAFYGLVYWDDWDEPNFLDELLLDKKLKPINLKYKKSNEQ